MKIFKLAPCVFAPSVLVMLYASPIRAQNSSATTSSGPKEPEAGILQEITVTAERTSSLLSKTPIAMTAITGGELLSNGVAIPSDLNNAVPNVFLTNTGGSLQITIRGVTSTDQTEKGDPAAAFMLDGVYIARAQVQEVSFFDIARIEVLRGPQGTLYGRNTTAGVINVISNKPTTASFEASASETFSSYDSSLLEGMVNLPLNDRVAFRFAGAWDRGGSYLIPEPSSPYQVNSPFRNNLSGRLQALFKFDGGGTFLLKADDSTMKGNGVTDVALSNFYQYPIPAGLPQYTSPVYVGGSSSQNRSINYDIAEPSRLDNATSGISGELNYPIGPVLLTYLGSYRQYNVDQQADGFGNVNTYAFNHYRQDSQEIRALTTVGGLKSQGGFYFFKEDSSIAAYLHNAIPVPGYPFYGFEQNPNRQQNYGIFESLTYSILPTLRVTAGARYSHDEKLRDGLTVLQQTPWFNPTTDSIIGNNGASISAGKTTWKLGLDYDLTPGTLTYATVTTGYKAGSFNDGCLVGSTVFGMPCSSPRTPNELYYKPETITAYEVGEKSRFDQGKASLDADAFYYDYSNLQLNTIATFDNLPTSYTTNAAKARVAGVEVEGAYEPTPRHRFDGWLTWMNGYYVDYWPLGVGTAPDFAGKKLDRSPDFTFTLGYTYTYPFSNGGTLSVAPHLRYTDSYVLSNFGAGQQFVIPSYTTTDLYLSYVTPDGHWTLEVFGKNLENKVVPVAIFPSPAPFFSSTATPSPPRVFGVRVATKF